MSARSCRAMSASGLLLLFAATSFAFDGFSTNSFIARWESVQFTSGGEIAWATNLVFSVFEQALCYPKEALGTNAHPEVLLDVEFDADGPKKSERDQRPLRRLSGHALLNERIIVLGLDTSTRVGMLYRFTNGLLHLELGDFNVDLKRVNSNPGQRSR